MTPIGEFTIKIYLGITLINYILCQIVMHRVKNIYRFILYVILRTKMVELRLLFSVSVFRFRLHFEKESKEEVEKRKKIAREKVLQPASDKELEVDIHDIFPSEKGLLVLKQIPEYARQLRRVVTSCWGLTCLR